MPNTFWTGEHMYKNCSDIKEAMLKEFNGHDPLAEGHDLLKTMSNEELIKFALIACNGIGQAIKGSDYENPIEAMVYLNIGVIKAFDAYNNAKNTFIGPVAGNA